MSDIASGDARGADNDNNAGEDSFNNLWLFVTVLSLVSLSLIYSIVSRTLSLCSVIMLTCSTDLSSVRGSRGELAGVDGKVQMICCKAKRTLSGI